MKRLVIIIAILCLFTTCDIDSNNNPNNNNNGNEEREKWDFFDFNNLYVDEMNFDVSIPDEFRGDWGQKSSSSGNGYSNLGCIEDLSRNKVVIKVIESGYDEYNIFITLTEKKLVFYYYYGYVDNINSLYGNYNIIGEKRLNFNLVASKVHISNYDNKEFTTYYFLSEDKQFGFTFCFLGYYTQISTNRIYVDTTPVNGNPVSSFMNLSASKDELIGLASNLAWIKRNAQSGESFTIEVNSEEIISPQNLNYGDRNNITIALKSTGIPTIIYPSSNGSLFTVGSGVTLILDNDVTLSARNIMWGQNDAPLVEVGSGGVLIMNTKSAIIGNTSQGGVNVFGTFTMTGGEISDNSGGGVRVSGGTFTMTGGKITGNKTVNGGGVYIDSGKFTMTGGEISGNSAYNFSGGGVYVARYGNFEMIDGVISGNTAYNGHNDSHFSGGGVYVVGNFMMKGGEISGNRTYSGFPVSYSFVGGGGVFVAENGTFTMLDGIIFGNTAYSTSSSAPFGGGVKINNGIFIKTGGTIYGYIEGDSNSNVVKRSSNTVQNNNGHAVHSSNGRCRETTAGPTVNLNTNTSDNWE
jgi:hypothetical protein